MEPDLLGYLWNCLDEADRRRVAAQLEADPELRDQLESLRQRVAPLSWDRDADEAPAGLAVQTFAHIAEHVCQHPHKLPPAPTTLTRIAGSDRPWWRRVDVAVAASIFVTAIALLAPAILHLNDRHARLECRNNLRVIWDGLEGYESQQRKLPDLTASSRPVAGMVVPFLRDAGFTAEQHVFACPGAQATPAASLTVDQVTRLSPDDFSDIAPRLLPSYAYSLGFRDPDGALHRPDEMLAAVDRAQLAIFADAPASPVAFGNSPNHGGHGQNLLFLDGHVDFRTTRTLADGRDDIYLNRANKIAAGLDPHDTVLGGSAAAP
jgi:hypothetical protein